MKRKNIPTDIVRLLWAKSGGYCQNPGCNQGLFRLFKDGTITTLQELAHIIAQSPGGPRGKSELLISDRDAAENIILLCPTCHTLIDKNAGQFPAELLLIWKLEHEAKISSPFEVPFYSLRTELRKNLTVLLRRNRLIYDTYGPYSIDIDNLFSDANHMWKRRVLDTIIPNNRRILNILTNNQHLLSTEEQVTVNKFALHAEGFEFNHLSGDKNSRVPTFPIELSNIAGN